MTLIDPKNLESQGQAKVKMLTQVVFGMVSKKCRNFGICEVKKINSQSMPTEPKKKKAICQIELINDRQIKFSFDLNSLTEEGRAKYFGKVYSCLRSQR